MEGEDNASAAMAMAQEPGEQMPGNQANENLDQEEAMLAAQAQGLAEVKKRRKE